MARALDSPHPPYFCQPLPPETRRLDEPIQLPVKISDALAALHRSWLHSN